MSTANGKEAKYNLADLQAALETETQLRLESEKILRQTQEEFEAFILTAAHDLKEPLRTISAYSELIVRKDKERSEAETDQFRRHITEGTGRIQTLIGGMVEYATAASGSRAQLSVDMNEVFRDAATHIASQSAFPNMTVRCDLLPVIIGDFAKLVKVARHLLDNGARYSDRPDPAIHVSARPEGTEWRFAVQDNGPGIEAIYRDRIFEPFKRLHGRQYTGVGLGLTFCRRVIAAHGGRLWVESQPNQGTTFCFTLPAAD